MDVVENSIRVSIARQFNEFRLARGLTLIDFTDSIRATTAQAAALLMLHHGDLELMTIVRACDFFGIEFKVEAGGPKWTAEAPVPEEAVSE